MRPDKKLLVSSIALFVTLAMIVPVFSVVNDPRVLGAERSDVRIYFNGQESTRALERLQITERYDAFVIARITEKQRSVLESQGYFVMQEPFLHTIALNGYVFDTRGGEPRVAESLRMDSYPNGQAGHYIVQFIGPIKEDWKHKVSGLGAEIGDYLPNNAFLIRMDAERRESVSQLDFVQWTGVFQPAYKIRPELLDQEGDFEVEIITYEGKGIYSVLSVLKEEQVISTYEGEDFGLVKAIVDRTLLPDLATLGGVRYIEPYYEPELLNDRMQWVHQTNIINNRKMWDYGIDGTNQVIAFSDTGLDYDHLFFREDVGTIYTGDLYNVTDLNRRKVVRYEAMSNWTGVDPWTDGDIWAHRDSRRQLGWATSGHGTMVSGTGAGRDDDVGGTSINDGLAKGAQIYLQDIGTVCQPQPGADWDDCLRYIPDDYRFLFGAPYADGARIHSNSWGTHDSTYDLEARMVDEFMWEHSDMLVIFSNGNGGPGSFDRYDVGSPATAKSIVSAGATAANQNNVASYSSQGPTADGRLKPTVTMVGEGTSSRSDGNPWSNLNTEWEQYWSGTSYAAPTAAGAAAIIRQYFLDGWYPTGEQVPEHTMDPSAALVKAVLAVSGQKMTGSYTDYKFEGKFPNNSQGWGRPLLDYALYFSDAGDVRDLAVVEHKEGLVTGNEIEYRFFVSAGEELKVQLVWTDYPGTLGAATALVNDLNLQVTAPNSFVYPGNSFSIPFDTSQSRPGVFDAKNPIEGVRRTNPQTGIWRVKVIAENVPAGPQPFALVVSGDLEMGLGQVSIDKEVYSDQDTINIKVQDLDAASVSVTVTSTTEPGGEVVLLTQVGPTPGVFVGSIDTKFEAPTPNGTLEVSDKDIIVVSYNDLSPVQTSTADAIVDAAGPMIYNVFVKDITNVAATITWQTDEPSDSRVYWGDTLALGNVSYDHNLRTAHAIDLIGLQTGVKYYFDVESSDWFSHATIDTNGGMHYTFTTTDRGEIVLIIGDESFPPERVKYYRNALEWGGWSYNLWYVQRGGDPPLSFLQKYKVVIWQTGLEQYPPFEDTQTVLLKDYMNGGGRLLVSSHDVAWALSPTSNSQFSTPDRYAFLRSILKADWKADPYTWSHVEGITGDPISGSYSLGSRIQYTYHREGASGDEVYSLDAGGTSFYAWKNFGPGTTPDNCAIRWFSSGLNDSVIGDDPDIVWDDHTSKLVDFFFEFTGLDFADQTSPIRGDVLNKTIFWLLNYTFHPVVEVSFPNGGEVFAGNTATIYWNRTATPGVSQQGVYYSDDSGQTWFLIDGNVAASATSYVWDISSIPNGDRYLVKVVVQDTNTPSLNGSDDSDGTFFIQRPGGDNIGPLTIPGSVKVSPNPGTVIKPIMFTATVHDTLTGNSNIGEAEFFVQPTEPLPGDFGTGYQMIATDGFFDSQYEGVEWQDTLTGYPWEAVGNYTIWVHGRDDPDNVPSSGDENWGTFYWADFQIVSPPPDTSVGPPAFVSAELTGASFQNVRIVWGLSPDDPAVGGAADVVRYEIFRGTVYDQAGSGYSYLGQVADGVSIYISSGDGDGNLNEYFYYVEAVDGGTNRGMSTEQAGKFTRYLLTGVNLVSTPLIPLDGSPPTLLQTLNYDKTWTYDSSDGQWRSYMTIKPYGGDFQTADPKMGIWVNVLSDDYFTVAGTVPATTAIQLNEGWNLVGYPSYTNLTVQQALTGISYNTVEGYDANAGPYYLMKLAPTSEMKRGEGYWIHVPVGATWIVSQ